MSYDISRFAFNPWNDFNGVVMQQGRVQLDSDWNESQAELSRRIRAGTLDTMGRAVYPATRPNAFKIVPSSSGAPFAIGVGRMYVDGLLAENHGLTAPPFEGWVPGSPSSPSGFGATWDDSLDELYINTPVDYDKQPYYPNAPVLPTSPGPYLIYLDVWQREVTFLEDPDLIEKAVGIDTTGRLQTICQVKWSDVSSVEGGVTCSTPDSSLNWPPLPSGGRLTTGVVQSSPSGPCCLTPNTGYTGMENQLYRVEINVGGGVGAATFKWSRDNASVETAVTGIASGTNSLGNPASQLTVQSLGKDQVLGFSAGNWIEIIDDYLELNGQTGELHKVDSIGPAPLTITLDSLVSSTNFPVVGGQAIPSRHTRIRRWDQAHTVVDTTGTTVVNLDLPGSTGDIPVPASGTAVVLENGVTVSFDLAPSNPSFNPGDFWTFAARTVDGTVESLVEAPPLGIYHHYARLAVLTLPLSTSNPPSDCRGEWPAVTVEHEGKFVGSRNTLNFTGAGVSSVTDNSLAQRIDIQISGGGSGESSPTRLLFPYCVVQVDSTGNKTTADTLIAISSTTADPFGPQDASAAVTVYCFDMSHAGSPFVFVPSSSLAPGGLVVFNLSPGLKKAGFPNVANFNGYVIADCAFAGAYGLAQLPPNPDQSSGPALTGTYLPIVLSRDVLLSVSTLTSSAPSVIVGGSVDFTVTLTDKVTVDTPVAISASPSGIATVPPTVTVPAGSASTTPFTVATSSKGTLTLTATLQGSPGSAQASVSIEPLRVKQVTAPSTMVRDNDEEGTVTLNGPAPAGGAKVTLAGGGGAVIPDKSVVIPQGSSDSGFNISPENLTKKGSSVKITAKYQGVTVQSNPITVVSGP